MAARVGDGFAEDGAGVVVDRGFHGVGVVDVDELGRPAEALNGLRELRDRAAVEAGGDDHVLARAHERKERHDLGRVARGAADGAGTALERGDAFLQHCDGGVGEAGVDVAHFLEVEEGGGMFGVAEDIGRALVDRRLAGAGGRIGARAGVDLQRVEAEFMNLVGHEKPP